MFSFPSADWVRAYGDAINASTVYREASAAWTHGAVAMIVNAQPDIGLPQAVGVWLDLDRGTCREARMVTPAEASQAPFVLAADYGRWKQVLRKELGPIAGIMQRKIALQGSLPIVVKFIKSAEALVETATTVPTKFLDEAGDRPVNR
ncbi:MAG TPA: SCP2 sterol-binding domain-containing protein [Gemmatimonadales bacterium]|nr:SCP2 sterol-binding domain-containing protein [Gemmatimonadales bacterium]